ncbi:ABC transporter ATP-binding protein [Risungbinella massiliensis]|uniref:ABC transporter ATP-binding protein n=1 Tax=Risungbinella massiliensis TaxID=1329796 RepID=UPI0005CBEC64|nr:ABC transporter ATP-binding protein [Risungbinella massiliensis]
MLEAHNVTYLHSTGAGVREIDFVARVGQTVGIIGPNGSGKSTLLRLLHQELRPQSGEVLLDSKPLSQLTSKERAVQIAVLTQEGLTELGFSTEDLVKMGRYPHQSRWSLWEEKDQQVVNLSMEATDTTHFRDRWLHSMSGGERQRVAIAKSYAQEPAYLLLDEPTTYLDLRYQWRLLRMLQDWKERHQKTLILVLHDMNLAALFCDQIYLLQAGRLVAVGTPTEVLTQSVLEQVYETRLEVIDHPTYHVPQILYGE